MTTSKKALSSCEIARKADICQKTAWYMMQKIRHALREENNIVLSGIIEADETFVGPKINRDMRLFMRKKEHDEQQEAIHGMTDKKRQKLGLVKKHGRPKGSTKESIAQKKSEEALKGERTSFEKPIVVFGMIERGGRVVMKKIGRSVKDVTKENIYPLLFEHSTRDSILMTDQLNLYDDAIHIFKDHFKINHNKKKYVKEEIHTCSIDNAWKRLKSMIRDVYHHVSDYHFERYLSENTYRWNRMGKSVEFLFEDFIPLTLDKTTSYKMLTENNSSKLAA